MALSAAGKQPLTETLHRPLCIFESSPKQPGMVASGERWVGSEVVVVLATDSGRASMDIEWREKGEAS